MKTAAAYIRVSTEDQVEYSPASQLDKIRQYAKHNGYILNGVYTLDEFKESKNEITSRIKELENKLIEKPINEAEERSLLNKKISAMLPSLKTPAVPEETKNSLIKSIINRIVFYRSTRDIDLYFYI